MASLLIVGNTNLKTFVNAILAAQIQAKKSDSVGLNDIFILHSRKSAAASGSDNKWLDALARYPEYAVHPDVLTSVTVELSNDRDEQIDSVARHVARFLRSLDHYDDVYVDLTNGTSHYKSVLSNVAFVIGARRPFILDGWHFPEEQRRDYWNPEQLQAAYVALPEPALLDQIAPAWLTDIRRFNRKAERAAETFDKLNRERSPNRQATFQQDIRHAINDWLTGEKEPDVSSLDGAVRYIGIAFEAVVRAVYAALYPGRSVRGKPTQEMLALIRMHLMGAVSDFDPMMLEDASQLLRRMRNDCSHEHDSGEFARVRARLATALLLEVTEMFDVLHERGLLAPTVRPGAETSPCGLNGRPGELYYFGLDGDDTGRELERLFQGNFEHTVFTKFSKDIDNAMIAVAKRAEKSPIKGEVLFRSGDDLLFKGRYESGAIEALRELYNKRSGGRTCSVGFGRTPKDAYVALKMAKASPGKDTVMGIEIIQLEQDPK